LNWIKPQRLQRLTHEHAVLVTAVKRDGGDLNSSSIQGIQVGDFIEHKCIGS
jgi:hypothetical protein